MTAVQTQLCPIHRGIPGFNIDEKSDGNISISGIVRRTALNLTAIFDVYREDKFFELGATTDNFQKSIRDRSQKGDVSQIKSYRVNVVRILEDSTGVSIYYHSKGPFAVVSQCGDVVVDKLCDGISNTKAGETFFPSGIVTAQLLFLAYKDGKLNSDDSAFLKIDFHLRSPDPSPATTAAAAKLDK